MIIVYHQNNLVRNVISTNNLEMTFQKSNSIVKVIQGIATQFPNEKIVWCNQLFFNNINLDFIENNSVSNNTILTFNPYTNNYLTNAIGYSESSPFININKKVSYPTWQMSSLIGYAHASVFLELKEKINPVSDFDYYLNSLSKTFMPIGLFCYSEPKLIMNSDLISIKQVPKASMFTIFKFVKQHYKARWVMLLLLDFVFYENKFPVFPFLFSLFHKNIKIQDYDLKNIELLKHSGVSIHDSIDVLIPTIGRKKYLYDVLIDLKNQTHLPKNVIIVEQNADPNSNSELDYISNETWPFAINHTFTHKLGACKARNIALDNIDSDWVFFADDDVRFDTDFLKNCLLNCKNYNKKAITLACLKNGETIPNINPSQWETFGTCSSFVSSQTIKNIRFDLGFEFGYGEDIDFGKKLRNTGVDIVFFPFPKMLHLKAPMGGFRTKFKFDWDDEKIQPKPSPTLMLYKLLHCTQEEINGYKTVLGFKYYKKQSIKNPIVYISAFKKQWEKSIFWANKLMKNN